MGKELYLHVLENIAHINSTIIGGMYMDVIIMTCMLIGTICKANRPWVACCNYELVDTIRVYSSD